MSRIRGPYRATPFFGGGAQKLDLFSGGTFTRSTEASYQTGAATDGSSPFISWASTNVRRVANRGDGLGDMLLMEGSRTNLVADARAIEAASFTAGSSVTTTANDGPGVDAALVADRSNVASGGFSRYFYQATVLNGVPACCSLYVRRRTGAGNGAYQVNVYRSTEGANKNGTATETWQRIDVLFVTSANATVYFIPCEGRGGFFGSIATAVDLNTDLLQWEAAQWPSSPIRSSGGAATRGADALSYGTNEYPASFLTTGFRFTFAPDFTSAEMLAAASEHRLLAVGGNDYLRLRVSGGVVRLELVQGGFVRGVLSPTWASRGQLLTISASPGTGALTLSGATSGDGTNGSGGAGWPSASLNVGSNSGGSATFAYGRFGRYIEAL